MSGLKPSHNPRPRIGAKVNGVVRLDEVSHRSLVSSYFWNAVLKNNYTAFHSVQASSEIKGRDLVGALSKTGWTHTYVLTKSDGDAHFITATKGVSVLVKSWDSVYEIDFAGASLGLIQEVEAALFRHLPSLEPEGDKVPVQFWSLGPNGPVQRFRTLRVPAWESIRDNYPTGAKKQIDRLIALKRPEGDGKLILCHGVPGTGKTYLARALAFEWRNWLKMVYIVDPDKFFEYAEYMLSVLLAEPSDGQNRWNMLVLEDSDEFLTTDAKERSKQGLSRLLNLTDGIVGQGLNLLVFMTTNEPIDKLHAAVAREGRTIANVEFPPFPVDEANGWLRRHGSAFRVSDKTILSDLYAALRGPRIENDSHISIGFQSVQEFQRVGT